MRFDRSIALDAALRVLQPVVVVFSLYVLFAGHNQPGGGFIAGLVAAAAVVLQFVARGLPDPRPWALRAHVLIGVGLSVAVLVAMAGWLGAGHELLDIGLFERDVPVLGKVKATSALPFDMGVYLVVLGVMVAILDGLGGTDDGAEGPPPAATTGRGEHR